MKNKKSKTVCSSEENKISFLYSSVSGPMTRRRQSLRENQELEINYVRNNQDSNINNQNDIRVLRSSSKHSDWSLSLNSDDIKYNENKSKIVNNGVGLGHSVIFNKRSIPGISALSLKSCETESSKLSKKSFIRDDVEFDSSENTLNWVNNLSVAGMKFKLEYTELACDASACNGFAKEKKIELANHVTKFSNDANSRVLSQFCLYLYIIFSWSFFQCIHLLVSDSESPLTRNFLPTSFEERLSYKLGWSFIFGAVADLKYWKKAFYCQSVAWIFLIFIFCWIPFPREISNILLLICVSSSNVVVFYVGIVNIVGPSNCLCHLAWMSGLSCLLPTACSSLFKWILMSSFAKAIFPILLSFGCATSLFMATLGKENYLPSYFSAFNSRSSSFKKFRDFFLLKFFIYFPSSLALSFYNSYTGLFKNASMIIVANAVIQICAVPLIYLCTSLRTVLIVGSCFLCLLYAILGSVVNWNSTLVVIIPLFGTLSLLHPYLDVNFISKFHKRSGLTISMICSSHYLVRYLSDILYSKINAIGPFNMSMELYVNTMSLVSSLNPFSSYITAENISNEAGIENDLSDSDLLSFFPRLFEYLFHIYNSEEQNEILMLSYIGCISSVFALLIVVFSR